MCNPRTLSEFWHWFVANVPGDSVDDGEVIFELLFPLVLPEGDGDHRYGFFVFEQPGLMDYREEGGPADSCSPNMSNGRGPFKSTKNFMKKYNLDLTAATFIILDSNEASMEVRNCISEVSKMILIFSRLLASGKNVSETRLTWSARSNVGRVTRDTRDIETKVQYLSKQKKLTQRDACVTLAPDSVPRKN